MKNINFNTIGTMILFLLMVPSLIVARNHQLHGDTVIIELENDTKIIVYARNKEGLKVLENYDFNQMIKYLNNQIQGDVDLKILEISADEADSYKKTSDSDKKYTIKDGKIEDDNIRMKIGGLELDVDLNEIDDFEDSWNQRTTISYEKDRIEKTTHHSNIDLGTNNWLESGQFPDINDAPYAIRPFGSWYLALNSVNSTWVTGPIFIEWGIGVSWYNWKLQNSDIVIEKGDNQIEFNPAATGIDGQKSKLTASYINAQFIPVFDFSRGRKKIQSTETNGITFRRYKRKGIRFGAGGYIGYRLGSHSKFVFRKSGKSDQNKEKGNLFLENFRYGLRAQIGWKGVELFGTYDLNNVFAPGRGPELNALSFGIIL